MKIFTSVMSIWYVGDSKIDFKKKIQPMTIAYNWFIKVRLQKLKKKISPIIARNIATAVQIATAIEQKVTKQVRLIEQHVIGINKGNKPCVDP